MATVRDSAEADSPDADTSAAGAAGAGLQLRDVAKHFGDVVAVEHVNLEIGNGEYVVLLGPSGCGKTTILRMIGGHEHPTSGDILLDGSSLVGVPPAKRPTTTVFQHFALFPHKSVFGNVEFGLRMQGLGKEDRQKRTMEMIDLVGLSEMRFRKPSELSGGQQQRVALARVLVTKPKLLLLDEPFGDLDRLLQLRMRVELRQLQRELGIAFIHVTHNQEEALSMADRIVVMEGGHIQQVGHPAEISQRPANVFVAAFMGDNNIVQGSVKEASGDDVLRRIRPGGAEDDRRLGRAALGRQPRDGGRSRQRGADRGGVGEGGSEPGRMHPGGHRVSRRHHQGAHAGGGAPIDGEATRAAVPRACRAQGQVGGCQLGRNRRAAAE